MVTAILFDAVLEGPGIHTRSHFASELLTHDFFSREALHAALFDMWQPYAPKEYVPEEVPYSSTPLVADSPSFVTLDYGRSGTWNKTPKNYRGLTVGTMQAMAPGTMLRGAVWGDPATLPEIFPERMFNIGKGRAPVRVIHAARQDVRIGSTQEGNLVLPIQVAREDLLDPRFRQMAYRRRCDAGRYVLLDMWMDDRVPRFVIDGVTVPALEYIDEMAA